ncbi:phage portal protein [Falsihalocynthiibacter sp. CO-5D18]|uniref:phage portal protein n=1 Tax=Falsihalocynthiibacter sp. CO-5D18 TaxID=3240872 RepID=UPI00350FE41E
MKHFSSANMLDRAVLAVSPQKGLSRISARSKARILMNFDAASNGPRLRNFKSPGTDADAASSGGRRKIRNRSRDLIRNAPFATRAQSVVVNNVVGRGVIPKVAAENDADQKAASEAILGHLTSKDFDKYGDCNIFSQQRLVMGGVFESGEILAVRYDRPSTSRLKLPFQVAILEIDYLDDRLQAYGGNEVVDGIEYDEEGVAIFYHIYRQHPGSFWRRLTIKSDRIPADRVLHIRRLDRAGQKRGVPWLAPVMLTLGEMRDYQEAQILKQKISALFAGVVTLPDDQKLDADEKKDFLSGIEPGSFSVLEHGQTVDFSDPPKVDDYDAVMRLGLMAVAMGIGITYESISGDLSRVNFSSMRAGRLEMDANVVSWQTQVILDQYCEGVARWALNAYRLQSLGKSASLSWTPQARPLVDPNKEIPSMLKSVEGGLKSRESYQRACGDDPDQVHQERLADAARDAEVARATAVVPENKEGKVK